MLVCLVNKGLFSTPYIFLFLPRTPNVVWGQELEEALNLLVPICDPDLHQKQCWEPHQPSSHGLCHNRPALLHWHQGQVGVHVQLVSGLSIAMGLCISSSPSPEITQDPADVG